MKKLFMYLLLGIFVLVGYGTIWASVKTDIEKANRKGKTVFLVVTEPGVMEGEKAVSIAEQAQKIGSQINCH
jgi:hypothetical protein